MNIQPPQKPDRQLPQLPQQDTDSVAAADLIRDKISHLYEDEPDALQELAEAEQVPKRSKHQQFMHELSNSGKDLAALQTEWHTYYQSLPPNEQHVVWQEFYSSQSTLQAQPPAAVTALIEPEKKVIEATVQQPQAEPIVQQNPMSLAEHKQQAIGSNKRAKQAALTKPKKLRDARSKQEVQQAIKHTVSAGGKLDTKHHVQSLLFGLGMGFVVVIIFLFGFFNEVVVAPFIQPSRAAASTPLIVSETSVAANAQSEVIIPKINVQIPTDFSQTSTDEDSFQNALESGIVHYPTTSKPGENGNTAFFGHSSNNIFNKGKYKFAFVLLHTMVPGDTFYLTYNSKVYVYKVIDKKVVDPSEVSVLDPVPGQTATATLITCDPPGTSLKRMVIIGQQISPDISGNTAAVQPVATVASDAGPALPGNAPTLFSRFIGSAIGKFVTVIMVIVAIGLTLRWVNKPKRS